MATLGGKVLLYGGWNGSVIFADTWTFDGTSWAQVSVSNPTPTRYAPGMAVLP
jgi:hypothetical protein